MKKIININLSGRVIPIEDSAYESLQRYIESLRRHFVNEEGRDEIINDIESRIAELMNDKIKKGATAVTDEDIDQIINSMGRVEDFETDADETTGATADAGTGTYTSESARRFSGRLYRDPNDKIVGGVCSGIANYVNIDPAIVRLLFALLIFGAGTGLLIYILLWILLPVRPLFIPGTTQPRRIGKRLFRNPDDRILGGVAGGMAAYFNKEAWIFRLIFAAPIILNIFFGIMNGLFFFGGHNVFPRFFVGSFTGTFVITYIILWIILPEAKTPYDKMEMRGEDVDVNTIKQNVQESMGDLKTHLQNWGEEVKTSAQNLGNRAKEFADTRGKQFASEFGQTTRSTGSGFLRVIGILIKAFVLFIAGIIAFSLFVMFIVMLFSGGVVFGAAKQNLLNFFLDGFWEHAFFWGTVAFFFLVPVAAFITYLVRRIMKIRSRRHSLAYIFGTLWFVGIVSAAALASSIGRDFLRGERLDETITVAQPITNKMIVTVEEPPVRYTGDLWFIEDGRGWDLTADTMKLTDIKVRVVKSDNPNYTVTLQRFSRGRSGADALRRAGKIEYNVQSLDSVLTLGSGFGIDKYSKYRNQRVIVEIGVPVGKMIRFDESVADQFNNINIRFRDNNYSNRNNRRRVRTNDDWNWDSYFNWSPNVDYVMTESGTLKDVNDITTDITPQTNNIDSLQRAIDEKNRQLEEERRRLEELKRNRDAQRTSTTSAGDHKKESLIAIPFIPVII